MLRRQYQLYIYSPIGPLISAYPPIKPDTPQLSKPNRGPNPISKYKAAAGGTDDESSVEHMGLGIKCLAWCPSGRAILVGGWEGTVEIVDPITGRCLSVIEPKRRVGKGVVSLSTCIDTREMG
jgi:WD40 repeat protein